MREPEIITTPEVARILGCSISTVIRRTDAGKIPTLGKLPGPNGARLYDAATVKLLAAS